MIQGVIFDLGSTLIRFSGEWSQVFEHSLDVLVEELDMEGLSFDQAGFKHDFSRAVADYHQQRKRDLIERTTEVVLTETLTEHLGSPPPLSSVKRAITAMYKVSQGRWSALPSTHAVLETLRQRGLKLGMISNASDESDVYALIDKAGIRKYLNPILTSAGYGVRKPHPDIFRAVLDDWGLPAERVVMVGDMLEADILGANRVGMPNIWMTEVIDRSQVRSPYPVEPDAIVEELVEVPAVIETFIQKGHGS